VNVTNEMNRNNIQISAFLSQGVFMCFVWISEQTAIISNTA